MSDPGSPPDFRGYIGRRIPRAEAARLLAGRGRFVDDVQLPRMLHAAFLRSPHAHARIVAVRTQTAAAMPGVVRVATGRDLAAHCRPWVGVLAHLPDMTSALQHPLALDRATWQGEPVAVVVAESRAAAEDALQSIEVDWDPLPAVTDPAAALAPGTPVIHPEPGDNLLYQATVDTGNVDATMAAAAHVVEAMFVTERHTGVPLESRGVVVEIDPSSRRLVVHQSTQVPCMRRAVYARRLDLPERHVRVVCADVGGGFGGKIHVFGDEMAARPCHRPARDASPQLHPRPRPSLPTAQRSPLRATLARRGAGGVAATARLSAASRRPGTDAQAGRVSRHRIRRLRREFQPFHRDLRQGRGIASQDGCSMRLEPNGAVTVSVGLAEMGQGSTTAIEQIAASAVRLAIGNVAVLLGDTQVAPQGGGNWGSRGTGISGEAAWLAGRALRDAILGAARVLLDCEAAQLDVSGGSIVDAVTRAEHMSVAELARIVYYRPDRFAPGVQPELLMTRHYAQKAFDSGIYTNGIQASHLEVDIETGAVRLLGRWVVDDCGVAVNPMLVEEQLRGSVVQGIGHALYEERLYDVDGQLRNGSLIDYLVPLACEMPDIVVGHVSTPTRTSTLGAKGAGEAGVTGAPAAIVNAVNDALSPLGVALTHLPVTPERILAALSSQRDA